MIKSIDVISNKILEEFGNRKKKGRLDLVYNANLKKFYPVPRDIEHKDFMPKLNGNHESLIPVQLHIQEGKNIVTHLLVGASSFEDYYKVLHPWNYLKEAYEHSFLLIFNSNFEIVPERLEIISKYSKR